MVTYSGYTFQVTWKNQLKHHYANPAEYVTFMGYFSSCTVYLRQMCKANGHDRVLPYDSELPAWNRSWYGRVVWN